MSVIELYEKLSYAPDDKTRARIIAEAFETLEERYPQSSDVATRQKLRETELRLFKEIDQVRLEIKAVEIRLTQAIHPQTLWIIGSVGTIIAVMRLLEWLLNHLARLFPISNQDKSGRMVIKESKSTMRLHRPQQGTSHGEQPNGNGINQIMAGLGQAKQYQTAQQPPLAPPAGDEAF